MEVQKLEDKINGLRDENQGLKDELQGKRMDFSREIALNDQSVEFLKKKIDDQQSLSEQRVRELEDQLC